jgi:hypothetical protein
VRLYRKLQRGAGVRIDLTIQRNFFERRCRPLHGFCPFRKQHSLIQFCILTAGIMEKHFAYQTLGAVSPWIQSCAEKLSVAVSTVTKRLSTPASNCKKAALVSTQ